MEFFDAVYKRYSHKGEFLSHSVPLSDLEAIAQAGLAAPTGMNTQCVRLIILKDRSELEPISKIAPTLALNTAPAAIALLTKKPECEDELNFEIEDYAASTENILLSAVSLGYASLWLDGPFFDKVKQKKALNALSVPSGYHLRAVIPIGIPVDDGVRRPKIPFEQRVSYGYFGKGKND